MTTKPVAPPAAARVPFPDTPRDDMQNLLYLNDPGYIPALRLHLNAWDTTALLSEYPIGQRNTRERRGLLIPDLMIAFDVDPSVIATDRGYSIEYHGKPPDFVLEITSPTTSRRDETEKRAGYAAFGVPEYWRFDDTGGQHYSTHLAGDRLVNGAYQPIEISEVSNARHWGYSAVLNLYVCWEYGYLRWYDPAKGYLPTHYEEATARLAAETERAAAETERDAERAGRLAAEDRNRRLEAEIRRLQNR